MTGFGQALGGLIPVAKTLVGIVSILQRRRARRKGLPDSGAEADAERRRQAARETERRMASYMAQRDMGRDLSGGHAIRSGRDEQENGR